MPLYHGPRDSQDSVFGPYRLNVRDLSVNIPSGNPETTPGKPDYPGPEGGQHYAPRRLDVELNGKLVLNLASFIEWNSFPASSLLKAV